MTKTKSTKTARRKSPARKKTRPAPAAKKTARKKKKAPSGYMAAPSGLIVPAVHRLDAEPVPPAKIRSGIARARSEIEKLLNELSDLTDGYSVAELELAASFSADGKFLGIGVGGATTIKIRFRPDEGGETG